jgi:hypothetical protein
MKRLAAVLAAALAAVSIYAVTAPAGPEAVSPARVRALEKRVQRLEAFDRRVRDCFFFRAVAITRYQDYLSQPQGTGSPRRVTALDATNEGDNVGFYVVSTHRSCIAALRALPAAAPRR